MALVEQMTKTDESWKRYGLLLFINFCLLKQGRVNLKNAGQKNFKFSLLKFRLLSSEKTYILKWDWTTIKPTVLWSLYEVSIGKV